MFNSCCIINGKSGLCFASLSIDFEIKNNLISSEFLVNCQPSSINEGQNTFKLFRLHFNSVLIQSNSTVKVCIIFLKTPFVK